MNLYLKERNDGTLNLYEPNHHVCLRTGIPDNEEEIAKTVKYFHAKYGGVEQISREVKKIGRLPNKNTAKRLETYIDETKELPYTELIKQARRTYNKGKLKPSPKSLRIDRNQMETVPPKPKTKPKNRKDKPKPSLKDKLKRAKKRKLMTL